MRVRERNKVIKRGWVEQARGERGEKETEEEGKKERYEEKERFICVQYSTVLK